MSKVNVFITIDTEHSIGGAFADPALRPVGNDKRIFGRIGGRDYGIPLIMDIADRYGIPLTFFVEVLNKYYFGEDETRKVCEYVLGRGHDVQLHLHPNFLNFKEENPGAQRYRDNMSSYSLEEQTALIAEGKELLTRYCGRTPVAFRAGNYGADANTLKALKSNAIFIDSSYNAAFPKLSRRICAEQLNDAVEIDGVWELPITNFIENVPLMGRRFKPLDLNGVSFLEMQSVVNQAYRGQGPDNLTFILHSFSFVRALDAQYERCKVRQYAVKRFEKLCGLLQARQNHLVCWTLADFVKQRSCVPGTNAGFFTKVAPHLSVMRGIEQKIFEI